MPTMDDIQFGSMVRAVRIRMRRPQATVAGRADVPRQDLSRLERGKLGEPRIDTVRRLVAALEMRVDIRPQWRGPELDWLVNGAHAALQGAVLRSFGSLGAWTVTLEVSYSIYGERGAIDILAWHPATHSLLVVELKTILVEAAGLVRKMDERTRLAGRIARQRGWRPLTVSSWVILTDTRTNRRHVAARHEILAPIHGCDGRRMRSWLADLIGQVAGLSFWDQSAAVITRRVGTRRVITGRVGTRRAGADGAGVDTQVSSSETAKTDPGLTGRPGRGRPAGMPDR